MLQGGGGEIITSHTFHFSSSSCFALYCLTRSSRTFFRPSAFVWSAGTTSLTVLSTKTPLIRRKHLRSSGRGTKVSRTSLFEAISDGAVRRRSMERCDESQGHITRGPTSVIPENKSTRIKLVLTCVLQLLAQHHQSSGQSAAACFCKCCIALGGLPKRKVRRWFFQCSRRFLTLLPLDWCCL